MSALVFQGDRQLTEVTVLAVDAQSALEHAVVGNIDFEPPVIALIDHLLGLAGLDWWFTLNDVRTAEEAEALRRELESHRDYVHSALFVAKGAAGDRVVWQLSQIGALLVNSMIEARRAATKKLEELAMVLKFLLEEEDPTGEVEQAFAFRYPPPQPKSSAVDFDFS
jgi:hypothetical protein